MTLSQRSTDLLITCNTDVKSKKVLTQGHHHESSGDTKGQWVALHLDMDATLLSWKPHRDRNHFLNSVCVLTAYVKLCD